MSPLGYDRRSPSLNSDALATKHSVTELPPDVSLSTTALSSRPELEHGHHFTLAAPPTVPEMTAYDKLTWRQAGRAAGIQPLEYLPPVNGDQLFILLLRRRAHRSIAIIIRGLIADRTVMHLHIALEPLTTRSRHVSSLSWGHINLTGIHT